MRSGYGALRLWATVLVVVGVRGVIFVGIGVIFAMTEAPTFGQALAFLLIGGPGSVVVIAFRCVVIALVVLATRHVARLGANLVRRHGQGVAAGLGGEQIRDGWSRVP